MMSRATTSSPKVFHGVWAELGPVQSSMGSSTPRARRPMPTTVVSPKS